MAAIETLSRPTAAGSATMPTIHGATDATM
jgi:hypothetical protein